MASTIEHIYTDELADWLDSISFYNEQIRELEKKLREVIRRNGIIDIATKVEERQKFLDEVSDEFYRLHIRLEEQELALKTDHAYIENAKVDNEMELHQNELRHQ